LERLVEFGQLGIFDSGVAAVLSEPLSKLYQLHRIKGASVLAIQVFFGCHAAPVLIQTIGAAFVFAE
jgi:hypothetical protein